MRVVQHVEDFRFVFNPDETDPVPKKYSTYTDMQGQPTRGAVKILTADGEQTIVVSIYGPLLTTRGTPFKDGIEYFLDAPELEEKMLEWAGVNTQTFEVKDQWMANGGLPPT